MRSLNSCHKKWSLKIIIKNITKQFLKYKNNVKSFSNQSGLRKCVTAIIVCFYNFLAEGSSISFSFSFCLFKQID